MSLFVANVTNNNIIRLYLKHHSLLYCYIIIWLNFWTLLHHTKCANTFNVVMRIKKLNLKTCKAVSLLLFIKEIVLGIYKEFINSLLFFILLFWQRYTSVAVIKISINNSFHSVLSWRWSYRIFICDIFINIVSLALITVIKRLK